MKLSHDDIADLSLRVKRRHLSEDESEINQWKLHETNLINEVRRRLKINNLSVNESKRENVEEKN